MTRRIPTEVHPVADPIDPSQGWNEITDPDDSSVYAYYHSIPCFVSAAGGGNVRTILNGTTCTNFGRISENFLRFVCLGVKVKATFVPSPIGLNLAPPPLYTGFLCDIPIPQDESNESLDTTISHMDQAFSEIPFTTLKLHSQQIGNPKSSFSQKFFLKSSSVHANYSNTDADFATRRRETGLINPFIGHFYRLCMKAVTGEKANGDPATWKIPEVQLKCTYYIKMYMPNFKYSE